MWPKLKFYGGFDQDKADNAEDQGGTGGVLVEFEDGRNYEISFEDVDTLKTMINRRSKEKGVPFYADHGMIVLEKVTLKNMYIAVRELAKGEEFNFFSSLKEWDPEKEERYHEKYLKGMPKLTYEYPTASEE